MDINRVLGGYYNMLIIKSHIDLPCYIINIINFIITLEKIPQDLQTTEY